MRTVQSYALELESIFSKYKAGVVSSADSFRLHPKASLESELEYCKCAGHLTSEQAEYIISLCTFDDLTLDQYIDQNSSDPVDDLLKALKNNLK